MEYFLKKSTTNISEEARKQLDISRDDYALCQYLHYRQGYPNEKMTGWCIDAKDEIADFVGISRPGLYKMVDRLERMKLIDSMPTTGYLRTTRLFIDTETGCKQSLQSEKTNSVNKVYNDCKQSLHGSVNKVTHKDECISKSISMIKNDKEEESEKNAFFEDPGKENSNTSFVEQKKEKLPPIAPATPKKKESKNWADVLNELQPDIRAFIDCTDGRVAWFEWLTYLKDEHRKTWKTAKGEARSIKHLFKLSGGNHQKARDLIEYASSQRWQGLYPIKEERQNTQIKNYKQNQYDLAKKVIADRDGLSF